MKKKIQNFFLDFQAKFMNLPRENEHESVIRK